MEENEAPENIYLYPSDRAGEEYEEEWGDKPWGEDYIEYTRTDTFIEKACEWLSLNIKMLMNVLDVEYDTHDTDIKDFIEDFRRYME